MLQQDFFLSRKNSCSEKKILSQEKKNLIARIKLVRKILLAVF